MGLFSWIGSAPKRLVGYGRKVVAGEQIEKGGRYIVDMATGLRAQSDRRETFENAYARLGMTEEKMQEAYRFYMNRFYLFAFFGVIGVIVFAYFLIQMTWTALAVVGFLAVCLSQLFNASFRMYQMRQRELLPVIEWLRVPSEWWIRELPVRSTTRALRPTTSKKKTN